MTKTKASQRAKANHLKKIARKKQRAAAPAAAPGRFDPGTGEIRGAYQSKAPNFAGAKAKSTL